MEQEVRTDEGVSLLDIVKLLLHKIKLLILVGILGAILGGAYAVYTTVDLNYYGTTVQFYVNPRRDDDGSVDMESNYSVYGAYGQHVMDNMVKLLDSDSFTEVLMLDGKTLPVASDWATAAEDKNLKFSEKLLAAQEAIDAANESVAIAKTATEYSYQMAIDHGEDSATAKTWATFAEEKTEESKVKLAEAAAAKSVAMEAWSKTSAYKSALSRYRGAISYRFVSAGESTTASGLARSFIYVDISTLNDVALANDALRRVKEYVPEYIEENMTVPGGYDGTNCIRTTRTDDVRMTNPGYTRTQAIKYAMFFGVAAAAVACVIVIIVDRLDKRLRDPDVISKKFYVPVLGIVPNIEMASIAEEETSSHKKRKKSSEVKK